MFSASTHHQNYVYETLPYETRFFYKQFFLVQAQMLFSETDV